MEQHNQSESELSWDEIYSRPLKKVSLDQVEQAFSKALEERTGQQYTVDVRKMDLNSELNAWATDTAVLDLKVSKKSTFPARGLFGRNETENQGPVAGDE
jgi:hypothetical protein